MRLAVIGAGAAGVAAAWRVASEPGHDVTVVHAGAGSTALYSGALDLEPWETAPTREPLDAGVLGFAEALGVWEISAERGVRVASREGVARAARGRDSALLDLSALAGKRIGVADLDRDDWDAALLANSLAASPWAVATSTRFEPIRVAGLRSGSERRISAYDFAVLHDERDRARLLAVELGKAGGGVDAWLLGPWLGVAHNVAAELAAQLGRPLGETLSPLGGPAGARFELARQRLVEKIGVTLLSARALRATAVPGGTWQVELDQASPLQADALILAVGGVAAGGVGLAGSLTGSLERGFRLSLEAPVDFELDGRPFSESSPFGVDLAARGLGVLERIGLSVDGSGAVPGAKGLYAAGDVVAGAPRTALAAVSRGLRTAEAAISRG